MGNPAFGIQFAADDSDRNRLEKLRRLSTAVSEIGRRLQTFIAEDSGGGGSSGAITMTGPALLGRMSGTGPPNSLTGAQVVTLLPVFTALVAGLVPAPGTPSGRVLLDNGTWGTVGGGGVTFGDPTKSIGLTVDNGTSTQAMRADAAPPLDQGIAPTWTGQHRWGLSLWAPDGTVSLPAYVFTADQDTGLYRVTDNTLGIATDGTRRLDVNTTRIDFTLPMQGPNGSAAAPTFSFTADVDTGLYSVAADRLGVAAAGAQVAEFGAGYLRLADGAVGTPVLSFLNDPDTGIYRLAANSFVGVAGGVQIWRALLGGTTRSFTVGDGTNSPSMVFDGAAGVVRDFFFQSAGSNRWGFRVNSTAEAGSNAGSDLDILRRTDAGAALGTAVRILRSNGQWLFEDGSAANPELSFFSDPDTGIYRVGTNAMAFVVGATARVEVSDRMYVGLTAAQAAAVTGLPVTGSTDIGLTTRQSVGVADAPVWDGLRVNTSLAAPSEVVNGNFLVTFQGRGYRTTGGAGVNIGGDFAIVATQTFTSTAAGARLSARVCPTDSLTRTEILSALYNASSVGTIRGPDGDATTPGWTFLNDPDTGMYRLGTNSLAFSTAGTGRMVINGNGRVLIGRTDYTGGTRVLSSGSAGEGGVIMEDTAVADASRPFYAVRSNAGAMEVVSANRSGTTTTGSTVIAAFDQSATATHTRFMIYDVDNGTLERVTVGAADSGGVGFKVLRIPN